MKNNFFSLIIISSLIFFAGCNQKMHPNNSTQGLEANHKAKAGEYDFLMQSVLWQQTSGEYRALCYQAFNIAQLRFDQYLSDENLKGKKLAIITDIDETVLDNSPFEVKLIEKGEPYTEQEWENWVNLASAKAVPGATEFLKYVESKNVEIFYISNRETSAVAVTIANMKSVNFPYADSTHVLFKTDDSAKKDRFDKIAEDYTILLFIGDNLGDFSSDFRVPSIEKRNKLTDSLSNHFGNNFIVLPNPMYGDWETKGVYKGKYDWTSEQMDSIRKAALTGY